MRRLIFIHGLNTFGDDLVHLGPLTLGDMHARWAERIAQRGIEACKLTKFTPLLGLGTSSVESQVERALVELERRGLTSSAQGRAPVRERIHLIGQSTGGLVARQLAHHPQLRERVGSVITIGTPHHGALAAERAVALAGTAPRVARVLKLSGYDLNTRFGVFNSLTPSALAEFNALYNHVNTAPCYSLVCGVKRSELALPLRALSRLLAPVSERKSALGEHHDSVSGGHSDGLISIESQRFGAPWPAKVLASERENSVFALDHFAELGYFLHHRPKLRERAKREFQRLVDVTLQLVDLLS